MNMLYIAYSWQSPLPTKYYDVEWLEERFNGVIAWHSNEIEKKEKDISKHRNDIKQLQELYTEYLKDKRTFVEKYYGITRKPLLKRAQKYSSYRDMIKLLDKFVQK